MMLVRAMACVLVTGCMSPVMTFGSGKSAKEAQRDTMSDLGPARLATDQKWDGEVATRKIRVWADDEYRAQNRSWQESFEKPLELANLVITPTLGLKLVAEYVAWDRHVAGARLDVHLAALMEHDAGTDVFAVIGLTSSLPLVSSTFDELGLAMLGGRHIVLRGYADLEERKLYTNAFPDLTADERELALVHLRHHKTAVVLLHELGHIFGNDHEADPSTIMHATYSRRATAFSDDARRVMLRTVDRRLERKPTIAEPAPVTAAAAQSVQPAAAPKPSSAATVDIAREPIVIRVTKAGHTIVDGKRLDAEPLDAMLKAAFADAPKTKIVIQEDRKVPAGVVGALLDRAKAIGFTKFEFGWSGR